MARPRPPARLSTLLAAFLAAVLALAAVAPAGAVEREAADPDAPPTASLPPPAGAPPAGEVYVAETGHYLRGAFLAYWQEHGGAAVFGYPLSEEYRATLADGVSRTVQLFDYARFEYHPDLAPAGAAVQLGQLGREAMGALIYPPSPPFPTAPGREYVAATGHWLSYGFRDYWYAHDGIHLLGYPLSEEMAEGPRTVQYFERGRLEYDPAAPPGRAVTMTPLGAELLLRRGWPLPTRLSLTLSEPSPGQGMTTVAELRSDRAVTVTAARLDDQPVDFFGDPYDHRALVGVPPWAAVGMHRLTVTVRQDDGQVKTLGADVAVRETAFPRERLDLPPDESGLLDPAVSAREEQVVAPLYAIFTPERLWSGPFLMPVQGPITTEFGEMRAYNGGPFDSWHQGLDIGAPEGTPIRAAAAGRVVYAGHLDIRGNFVAIDDGLGVLTCYFHQSRIAVTVGQSVAAGDIIGYVGSTGLATGPHLHFEVRVAGTPVSPWQWMQGEVLK